MDYTDTCLVFFGGGGSSSSGVVPNSKIIMFAIFSNSSRVTGPVRITMSES